jgi:hypothetical protein
VANISALETDADPAVRASTSSVAASDRPSAVGEAVVVGVVVGVGVGVGVV